MACLFLLSSTNVFAGELINDFNIIEVEEHNQIKTLKKTAQKQCDNNIAMACYKMGEIEGLNEDNAAKAKAKSYFY